MKFYQVITESLQWLLRHFFLITILFNYNQARMQLTCTHTTSHRLNAIVRRVIRVVRKDVGEKDQKIAKNSAKSTAHHNARKADASDRDHANVVTYSVLADALVQHKKTV
jgi:hypothetical protein